MFFYQYQRPESYESLLPQLELTLPAFGQATTAAHQARVAANGGRTGSDPEFPMLVSDANQLNSFFREAGAYADPDDPPAQPPLVPVCASGTAVADPNTNRGLVYDCSNLLGAKDTLRGTAALNWSVDVAIGLWDGVTTGGTPTRVTKVELSSEGLSGSVPPELGSLFGLTHLDLSMNALTGSIPAELGLLANLQVIRLSGNSLTGCTPVGLQGVTANDLSSLNLLYCAPPAPGNLTGTLGETSVALSWDAVSNASKYRVEHRTVAIGIVDWTADDETITGRATRWTGWPARAYTRSG